MQSFKVLKESNFFHKKIIHKMSSSNDIFSEVFKKTLSSLIDHFLNKAKFKISSYSLMQYPPDWQVACPPGCFITSVSTGINDGCSRYLMTSQSPSTPVKKSKGSEIQVSLIIIEI